MNLLFWRKAKKVIVKQYLTGPHCARLVAGDIDE